VRLSQVIACAIHVVAIAGSGGSFAQQAAPSDGKTCFCLLHDGPLKPVQHDCTGFRPAKATDVTATCRGEDLTATPVQITVAPPWSVLTDGQEGCVPCRGSRKTIKVPRNDSADQ
jgi:hypothetical protein